jgi:bifunctional DNA-binding transcriptional regulator/antitoxin component of YhaV-PrlF toxin-antitoxin module
MFPQRGNDIRSISCDIPFMRYRNNIRALQGACGLTINLAAQAMGMSRGGYLKIQRGENRLTSTPISLAAQAFGVSEGEIVADGPPNLAVADDAETTGTRLEKTATGHEPNIVNGYVTLVEEDGTTTFPAELREMWALKAGDKIEFFRDHLGGWQVRPRNAGPLDFLERLPPRKKRPDVTSDADALNKALLERNRPPSAAKAER